RRGRRGTCDLGSIHGGFPARWSSLAEQLPQAGAAVAPYANSQWRSDPGIACGRFHGGDLDRRLSGISPSGCCALQSSEALTVAVDGSTGTRADASPLVVKRAGPARAILSSAGARI